MAEQARDRVALRYYQSWLQSSTSYRRPGETITSKPRSPFDDPSLRAPNDRTLIALAQLGCFRLTAKQATVVLVSADRQYVLGEATTTTSLGSRHDDNNAGDELRVGHAALPRHQRIFEDTLEPGLYTATGPDGTQHSAPALVVSDVTKDSRYCDGSSAGNGVNFCCGVPLTTSSGLPIGAYIVTDDHPRDGLMPTELQYMQDLAATIMDHLETALNNSARSRGEQLVLGLGRFVQGEPDVSAHRDSSEVDTLQPSGSAAALDEVEDMGSSFQSMNVTAAAPNAPRDHEDLSEDQRQKLSRDVQTTGPLRNDGHFLVDDTRSDDLQSEVRDSEPGTVVLEGQQSVDATDSSQPFEVAQVFSRAADVLRECTAADGVVFYDAVSNNFAKGPAAANAGPQGDLLTQKSRSSGSDPSSDSAFDSSDQGNSPTPAFSADDGGSHILSSRGKKSRIIGYSLDISDRSTASESTIKTLALSEASLRRFIRRYPGGKIFYFSEQGGAVPESDRLIPNPTAVVNSDDDADAQSKMRMSTKSSSSIIAELNRIIPGARSVMWLPLWDFSKRRWSAGCFLWSQRPDRLLHGQSDLTYLRTFASCIMGEIARVEAVSSDSARTSFMTNISHELRTPLHGILGSVEFLQDTGLDDFQSSMSSAIENCGRTMLDTVESVLNHAKINDILKKRLKRKNRHTEGESAFERDFDLALTIEDVVEAVYCGHTFLSIGRVNDTFGSEDAHSPPAEATRAKVEHADTQFSDSVRVILEVQKLDNWCVRGQPGALRRIIMNLFGNALKYTKEGTITVSLISDVQASSTSPNTSFSITVSDTGIGMEPGFLRNHAFTAFTQESRFSAGVGLGLNIVRQLVHAMRGKVEVSSEQGTGTSVRVWLSLPRAHGPSATQLLTAEIDPLLERVVQKTKGKTVCLLDPSMSDNGTRDKIAAPSAVVQTSIRDLLIEWFGIHPITAPSMNNVSADFFLYAEPPPIEYLLEHHGVHARSTEIPVIIMATNAFESSSLLSNGIRHLTDIGRVVEVTSQPCGPQKLAKFFHRAMMRIAQLARDPRSQRSSGPADQDVHQDGRTPEPYLGDSDSQQDIQHRLKRTHSDHPQPRKKDRATAAAVDNGEGRPSERPTPIPEQPTPLETEDNGFIANRDEPESTLSPTRPKRPPMLRTSTLGSSNFESDNASAQPTPDPTTSRVLLVDDNDINLKLLVAFMKKAKLRYETATDGSQALQAYKDAATVGGARFAHVLMDVAMPVMDGIEATREIRRFEGSEQIVPPANIVAVTGQASETTRKDMADAGADEFKIKPVKFKELIGVLERSTLG